MALGDYHNARQRRVLNLGSRETGDGRATGRFIDLPVSPLAEALLLWADMPGPAATARP